MKSYLLRMIWPTIMIVVLSVAGIFGDHADTLTTVIFAVLGLVLCFAYMVFIDFSQAKLDKEPGYLEDKLIETMDGSIDRCVSLLRRLDKRDGVVRTDTDRRDKVLIYLTDGYSSPVHTPSSK